MAAVSWTSIYSGMLPAGVNPMSSVQIYGKGALGTQWYRIQAATESGVDYVKSQLNKNLLKELSFLNAPMHANAYEATWKLALTIPEEELLKNMRKNIK